MGHVQLEGLSRTFPGSPPVTALKPCSLQIDRGDQVMIVGPSGSGKSTLLNLLGLLDAPTSGRYLLDGRDMSGLPDRERTALRSRAVGFVFQTFHLVPYLTSVENVELAMLYGAWPRVRRRTRALEALARVGLGARLDALPATLSGGERQRVAIARAIVTEPTLLLCDEPTGNLDGATSVTILGLLRNLQATGITLVIVTHDPEVAANAARIVTIRDGVVSEPDRGGRRERGETG